MARISILTPNFNHAHFLSDCIESVVLQSRLPDEFLILDDASTDNSMALIEKYARQYPFIRYWQHKENKGVGETLGELFNAATGDFVLGLAADDALLPGFLQEAARVADQHPDIGVIIARHLNVPCNWDYWGDIPPTATTTEFHARGLHSPSEFLQAILENDSGMFAFSIAALYNRSITTPRDIVRPELEGFQDVFSRLRAGARGGAYFLGHLGQVFRWHSNSRQLADTNIEQHHARILKMTSLMRSAEYRALFDENFVSAFENTWQEKVVRRKNNP